MPVIGLVLTFKREQIYNMTKLKALLIVALLVISGCGQKGPLLVKPETPEKNEPDKTDS
jgi:predicted small lipoprotein YifL